MKSGLMGSIGRKRGIGGFGVGLRGLKAWGFGFGLVLIGEVDLGQNFMLK